jgi:hypothetical protein
MAETSSDSGLGVSGILFRGIHDSFTTQDSAKKTSHFGRSPALNGRHISQA